MTGREQELTDEAGVVLNKDGTIRQKSGRKPKEDELPELTQLEQNALIGNLPNIEMMLEVVLQACGLIRRKDQLERQVDKLERQVHDTRTTLDREQQRLGETKAQRMEFARG